MHSPPTCLAEAVEREIMDEQVLWADSPSPGAYARRCWPKNLIAAPFIAVAVYWTLGAAGEIDGINSADGNHTALIFTFLGCMFICAGLGTLLSPLWALFRAERIYYVLTSKRAVIFEKARTLRVRSIGGEMVRGYERVSFGAGSGDIIFYRAIVGSGKRRGEEVVGFLGIDDVRTVETLLDAVYAQKS